MPAAPNHASPNPATAPRALMETFLLNPRRAPLPDAALLRRHRLAAYAYTQRDASDPARAELRPDLLTAITAHETAIAAFIPLLEAWAEAGVEVLLMKGFALALSAYDQPAQRFYDDLDLAIHPEGAEAARRVARGLGWAVHTGGGHRYAHAVMQLRSPDRRLEIDVHRLVVHAYGPGQRLQRRITAAAWDASVPMPLGRANVRVLDPRDAVLIGLVMNRCWSGDDWRIKPRDYLDFRTVVERNGVTKEALVERARELRAERTLALFLERCDPYARRLDLTPPSRRRRLGWSLRVIAERRPYRLDRLLKHALKAPTVLSDTARELPGVLRALRLLRAETDLHRLLAAADPPARGNPAAVDEPRRYGIVRGVNWSLKLLRARRDGDCVPRSLAIFAALRRLGAPAVFVSGVRQAEGDVQGHAWVELDGEVLPELAEPMGARYVANLRYPD
jgi:hypothetical protein